MTGPPLLTIDRPCVEQIQGPAGAAGCSESHLSRGQEGEEEGEEDADGVGERRENERESEGSEVVEESNDGTELLQIDGFINEKPNKQ